jgi:hypothetical protein
VNCGGHVVVEVVVILAVVRLAAHVFVHERLRGQLQRSHQSAKDRAIEAESGKNL